MRKVWNGVTNSTNRRHFFLDNGHSKAPVFCWGQMTLYMKPGGAVHLFLTAPVSSPEASDEQEETTVIDPPPPEPVKITCIPGQEYEDQEYTPVRDYRDFEGKLRHREEVKQYTISHTCKHTDSSVPHTTQSSLRTHSWLIVTHHHSSPLSPIWTSSRLPQG
jgi:hypothetical protein